MGHKAEPVHVGSKITPICDAAATTDRPETDYSNDGSVNRRKKALSRMKELIKWAVAAKTVKGGNKRWKVLYFGKKGALKCPFDETSPSPSKISFRWDAGSCSTSSSAFSPMSLTSSSSNYRTSINQHLDECSIKEICLPPKAEEAVRMGNWITTDSEFVVLEL